MKYCLRIFFVTVILLKSVRVHFASGKIGITLELLGQFLRFYIPSMYSITKIVSKICIISSVFNGY